ncbi:hypothetical protein N0V93_009353 [Gnomoniopsis smithogilvyi]|uniref:Uncharacterized protein n=1 Tax=Gnomoniopsis smithogilvyi TaxID=1191159 RepID=A0A9W9CTL8_9PEZI|nr:hypothetical protein N0V93_009353 [Gnomoniopsis smithogilvyi]
MVRPSIPHDLDITAVPSFPHLDLPLMPSTVEHPDFSSNPNIRSRPLPGVRCPTCAQAGKESWVIPGRACSTCGTPCF